MSIRKRTFTFQKYKKAQEFYCSNCGKTKKSKNMATCDVQTLCNGCFGYLLSKNLITRN